MRYLAIAVAIVAFCHADAAAQGLEKGVRGGANLTTAHTSGEGGDNALDWQWRGVVGGFVTWPVLSWLELQPEVLYALKGAKSEEFGISSKVLLDYVEVPVLARVSRGARGGTRYYVAGGPTFAVLTRARTRADFGDATEEVDISDDVERFDLGVAFGGGIEFGSIVVDGRYTLGIRDIDKDTSDDVKVTNRAASFTVGIKF